METAWHCATPLPDLGVRVWLWDRVRARLRLRLRLRHSIRLGAEKSVHLFQKVSESAEMTSI